VELRCHACAHSFVVPDGTLSASCGKCGALITLTALETRVKARGLVDRDGHAPEALLGKELGGYELTAILGGGGMGVVYEAKRTERATFRGPDIAAIKVLSPAFALDAEFIERFRREADALTKLRHDNLIEVYAKGEEPCYYFVMERFYGEDLRSFMSRGSVSAAVAAAIVRGAAQGLAYAHANGIVHRDVKPANILVSGDLTKDGRVKVVDFGVAQLATGQYTLTSLTRSELVLGTINYMSPEQRVDASEVDHRADVYALGVVAYELLTGRLPIGAFEPPSELGKGVTRAADKAVLSALRRDPDQRPRTTVAFAELLEHALVKKRSVVPYLAAAAAAVVLLAFGGGSLMVVEQPPQQLNESPPQQEKAEQQKAPPIQAPPIQAPPQPQIDEAAHDRTASTLRRAAELGLERATEVPAPPPEKQVNVKKPASTKLEKPAPAKSLVDLKALKSNDAPNDASKQEATEAPEPKSVGKKKRPQKAELK
jgi:serine/threonine protein kinase